MAKLSAPLAVVVVTFSLTVGLLIGGSWGETMFAIGAVCLPAVLLLLGEPRQGSPQRLRLAALLTALLLGGGFASLLRLSGEQSIGDWWLGLPVPLAIQVYVMSLIPLVVIGILFAWDFSSFRPRSEDVDRIRSLDEESR